MVVRSENVRELGESVNEISALYRSFLIKGRYSALETNYQKINVQKYIPKVKKRCYNMYTE